MQTSENLVRGVACTGKRGLPLFTFSSHHFVLNLCRCVSCTLAIPARNLGGGSDVQEYLAFKKYPLLGPYSRTIPKVIRWSCWGGGLFLMSEEPLYEACIVRPLAHQQLETADFARDAAAMRQDVAMLVL